MVLEKTHQEYATYFIRSYPTFKHNSTNLFWPEQLRRLAEMPGKVSDTVDVDPDGVR
jgi:hypothetical protein